METFVSKIDVLSSVTRTVYTKVLWNPNDDNLFDINIFYKDKHWSGSFSYDSVSDLMLRLDETKHEYVNTVRDCLRKQNSKYKYEFIVINEDSAKFSWKKTFDKSTAVMLHGTVDLRFDPYLDKDSLINLLLEKNENFEKKLLDREKTNDDLLNDLEKCRNEFEQLINVKNSLETTLYGKFVQLLNSKKRRIQMLEDNLEK